MTDTLLEDLKTAINGEMNILIATKELETFINSYAKQQLTPANHTIMERRDEFGQHHHEYIYFINRNSLVFYWKLFSI